MEKKLNDAKEHYRNQYFNEEMAERIKGKVRQRIRQSENVVRFNQADQSSKSLGRTGDIPLSLGDTKVKWSWGKKISYTAGAAVVLFGLFVGSAFVSPAMAEVAAKVPFLTKIFESKPIDQDLWDTLHKKGYTITGVGYRVQGKEYSVMVDGSEDYFNKVKDDIEKETRKIIESRGYDDYKIVVERDTRSQVDTSSDDPREKITDASLPILEKVIGDLQDQSYQIQTFGVGFANPDALGLTVDVTIADTETRKDEISKAVREALEAKDIKVAEVKFYEVNLEKKAIEGEWTSKVLPVIWEGLAGKKEFKTKGFAYSFKSDTFKVIIKTTVAGNDEEAQDVARNIQATVREYLNSEQLKPIVKDQPYEIIVRDKKGKDIEL